MSMLLVYQSALEGRVVMSRISDATLFFLGAYYGSQSRPSVGLSVHFGTLGQMQQLKC